jgi:hypothetical protein
MNFNYINNILNLSTILPNQINENYVNFIDFKLMLKLILLNYLVYKVITNFIYYPLIMILSLTTGLLLYLYKKNKDYCDEKRNIHMLNSRKC